MQLEKDSLSLQAWLLWVTSEQTEIQMSKYIYICSIYLHVKKRSVHLSLYKVSVCWWEYNVPGRTEEENATNPDSCAEEIAHCRSEAFLPGSALLKSHSVACLLTLYQSFKPPTPFL